MAVATKNVRRSAKGRFIRKYNDFEQYIKDSESMSIVTIKYGEVKEAWDNLERIHDDYMSTVDDCNVQEGDVWIQDLLQKYNKVVRKHEKQKEIRASEERIAHLNAGDSILLEKTKLPRFTGNIRDYAHFKCDFQKYVEPNVPVSIVAYTLKSCLSDDAAHKVRNEDSVTAMWAVLDDKYADPATVADVIMDGIERTKTFTNGETYRFVQFIEDLEDSYHDLCKLGLQREITTTSSVSTIEHKLSPDLKTRWARRVVMPGSTVDRTDKFPSLLKFLIEEKKTVEYRCASLRKNENGVREGTVHHIDVAAVTDVERQGGHVSQTSCDTCLLHGNSDHCTEDCVEYLVKSVDQRVALLRHKRACWACLGLGHQFRECRAKRICGENDCRRRHHRTIHPPEINTHRINHIAVADIQSVAERRCDIRIPTNLECSEQRADERITSLENQVKEQELIHRQELVVVNRELQKLRADNIRLSQNENTRGSVTTSIQTQTSRSEPERLQKQTIERLQEQTTDTMSDRVVGQTPDIHTSQVQRNDVTYRRPYPLLYQITLCSFVVLTLVSATNADYCCESKYIKDSLDKSDLAYTTVQPRYSDQRSQYNNQSYCSIRTNTSVVTWNKTWQSEHYQLRHVTLCAGECFVHKTKLSMYRPVLTVSV